MNSPFQKRLSFRLTRNTVLLAMVLGLLLNIIQVSLDFFHASEAMDQDIQALMEISHSPASQIAYNIDARLAEELLTGLLKHPAIVDARIVDPEDRTLAAASRSHNESRYRWLSDLLFGSERFYSQDLRVPQLVEIPLGELAVNIDTYHYGTDFLNRAAYTIVSGIIKSLVLSALLLFAFYFVLTKPMLRVIEGLREVSPNEPEKARLPVPATHDEDEIGLMVRIINQHLDTIDASLDKLRVAEGELKNYSVKLEREVEDRTREISDKNLALQRGNRALIRAKEDAVRRARSRANFLASMSHEIRTPLNGVLGMLGLTLEGDLDPAQRNRLEIALNAGQSLLGLLNDILDISKVEAGKLNLEAIPFDMRSLVEECTTLHAQKARRENIEVVADIEPTLPEKFIGDPTRARQIINNLIGNAIKFTDQGEVRVSVRQVGSDLRLDVTDTGIGMSPQSLGKIFSPFAQADTDTTRRYGGTGLGLTLCRQLVERMHGQISVESEEHRGTRFTVTLPLPKAQHESQSGERPSPSLAARGVRLLVPHNHPHRHSVERQLKAWGFFVEEGYDLPAGEASETPLLIIDPNDPEALSVAQTWPSDQVIVFDTHVSTDFNPLWQRLALPVRRYQLYRCLNKAAGASEDQLQLQPVMTPARLGRPAQRLLLVEDNRVNQIVAGGLLRKLGYEVDLAENGERALNALNKNHYAAVLMDCQMPVMDGYEATRRIRSNPAWQHLPVIAVTANVMQGDKDACLAAGMSDYITKPYDRQDLKNVIERWTLRRPQDG
ncbi:hybrid sensor histidine kinase/response regulator [Marinobacter salicampi]|uniref:hybrid sensor histidine kinase/response regulator n=1 Tax=Marinobacter salicampi TaxID=435907 RepID=UPI00140C3AB2|nr:ATP-binding protein [Marinobacter salicampi]